MTDQKFKSICETFAEFEETNDDHNFVAWAASVLPGLLTEIEILKKRLSEARDAMEAACDQLSAAFNEPDGTPGGLSMKYDAVAFLEALTTCTDTNKRETMRSDKQVYREAVTRYVKGLPSGGTVVSDRGEYTAYDSSGRYLGFCETQEEAEFMAENMYTNCNTTDAEVPSSSLWALWNDAIRLGCVPLEEGGGKQFLFLGYGMAISARKTKTGHSVELIKDAELWDLYSNAWHKSVLELRFAVKPLILEQPKPQS